MVDSRQVCGFGKVNAKKTPQKRCDARLKVAAKRLLEEIISKKIVATCFPNGVSVGAQSLYQVQLHEINQRSLATVRHKQQMKAAKSMIERGTFSTKAKKTDGLRKRFSRPSVKKTSNQSTKMAKMFLKR